MTETHPQNRRFGYARASTYGQTLDAQLEQLRGAGCTTKIYREKVTGGTAPPRASQMLKALAPGDVVTGDAHRPPRALPEVSISGGGVTFGA